MDFRSELDALERQQLLRVLRTVESDQGPRVMLEGRSVLLLASNNYLGLANHPKVKEAAIEAVRRYGVGSGASRLISGSMTLHKQLEDRVARFKSAESAVTFSSGYLANLGILPALLDSKGVVLCDRLNHASLFDGCRLGRAKLLVYRHKDVRQVRQLLERHRRNGSMLIATDGVFSMDGDLAPLPQLAEAAEQNDALLMVDEAHATGVMGPEGRGSAEHFNLVGRVPIQMGTFSKALGTSGAYVAGSRDLIEYLKNRARTFIYTTAPPPAVAAATLAAIEVMEKEPERRKQLWENRRYLHEGLKALGFDTLDSETPILPIRIGKPETATAFSRELLEAGIFIPAIRPPTVPKGTSRLRLSVMATHTREDLTFAIETLGRIGRKLGLLS
jgi:8-amino-7-oxononanoate synthase